MSSLLLALALLAPVPAAGTDTYRPAPQAVREVLDAPLAPFAIPSPTGDRVLLARSRRYPPIAELAEPMYKLAGVRVHPRNNARQGDGEWVELALQPLANGPARRVALPTDARVGSMSWNATGTLISFTVVTDTAVELWMLDAKTAKARRIPGVALNGMLGDPVVWLADQRSLLVRMVPKRRPPPPVASAAAPTPRVHEGNRVASASSTYESRDLLRSPHDADLFEYHATS